MGLGVNMNKLLLRWLINAAALYVAARIVPGIELGDQVVVVLGVALVFGLVNALLRPLLTLLTCPLIILTLGLFTLAINAALLLLTSALSRAVGLSFVVEGFWPAFWGGLVVSIVSLVAAMLIHEDSGRASS
jgi:putative membrane protein